jgi:RNA 3'-terminal phosphate cyclase (ATP)
LTIRKHGFYPAGGGEITVEIQPCPQLQPLHLTQRGNNKSSYAESWLASLPAHIADRELATVREKMGWSEEQTHIRSVRALGHGNVLLLFVEDEHVTNVFSGFGEFGVSAEKIATNTCKEAQLLMKSEATVDEYLADQLLLPMALAGAGSFSTTHLSSHCQSNMAVIQQFLAVSFNQQKLASGVVQIDVVS